MQHNHLKITNKEVSNSELGCYANGIFIENRTIAILMALFIWVLGIPVAIDSQASTWSILQINLLQEIIGSLFFIYLASRLGSKKLAVSKVMVALTAYLVMWILSHMHTFLFTLDLPNQSVTPIIAIGSIISLYLLGYYFFYVPYLFDTASDIFGSLKKASIITSSPRAQAIRVIATGLIVSLCVRQFFEFFKLPAVNTSGQYFILLDLLGSLSQAVYWFITTFLALSFAAIMSKDSIEKMPNRAPANGFFYYCFGGTGIGKFLLAILLLAAGSVYLTLTSKPDFTIAKQTSTYDKVKYVYTIDLIITAKEDSLIALQPMFFRIAGEDGYPLSEIPLKIEPTESLSLISSGAKQIPLQLSFTIINRQDDFDRLDDASLWYLNHKVLTLR